MTSVLYTTNGGWNIWLATAYTENGAVTVYGLDDEDNVIEGYIPDGNLDDELVNDEEISQMQDNLHALASGTSVGLMYLFTVYGSWTADQEDPDREELQGHRPGDFITVTTATRVFLEVDDAALTSSFSSQLQGCFTADAVVQIQSVEEDADGNTWYCVLYLYGDDFANGRMKWTETATVYVLATDTTDTDATELTATDYAYTA